MISRNLSRAFGVAGVVLFGCVAACVAASSESSSSSSQALQCPAAQRAFNGACRDVCSETKPCASGELCAQVDPATALCLEPTSSCAYLGDDAVCEGQGGFYQYSRGGFASFVPYSSYPAYPYEIDDATLTSNYDPYFYAPYGGLAAGCQGDAKWVTVAPKPGAVACKDKHTVKRCRLVNHACTLVTGTTPESVQPSAP